ncbi:Hypothetical predicted protein, partial [Paramuricea clavata]
TFNILSKYGRASITEEDIDSLSKDDLRRILLILERYEPSNTYTYEYSYIRQQDIRLLIDTLIKQDGVVILDKFVKAYQEHLGGTETFAVQLFKGFMSKNENMATTDEVEQNLDTILKPYVEYRKKAGLDDDDNNEGDNADDHDDDNDDDQNDNIDDHSGDDAGDHSYNNYDEDQGDQGLRDEL